MYLPNFLDGFDRLVAFDAETTGKRTPDAGFYSQAAFRLEGTFGIDIEVAFVEMLREGEGNCGGATPPTRVRPPILIVRPW